MERVITGPAGDFKHCLRPAPFRLMKQISHKTAVGLSRKQPVEEKLRADSRYFAPRKSR